nr:stabilin-1-like isoform X2 [Oncorhynchus nerka]
MHGWEGSTPSSGCTLKNVCNDTTCHPNAGCESGLDGYPRCLCNAQQIGDGYRCYGNLMERLVELNREGTHKGKLSGAILLFVRDCMLTISQQGPFTAFVPLSSLIVPLAGVTDESACQRYLVRGQYLYKSLDRTDVYTASGLQLRFKPNKQFMLVKSPETLYSVIQQDIPAANGVIHIIDQPIIPRNILPDSPKDEQFADKTIGEILTKDEKYNRFLSLVDNCGTTLPLRGPGPLTVFVPTNDAVDRFRDGRLIYMLFHAQNKLQELLKQHIYSQAALTVDQLASMGLIQTMANQILLVNLTNDGLVLLGGKPLQITNIMASNGVIHMIDGVLVPPSIVPILPKRCDVTENKIIMGPCVRCSYLYESHCPEGSIELQSHMKDCDYQAYPFNPTLNKGCAKYCNTTIQFTTSDQSFVPYGALWSPMEPYGVLWNPTEPYGALWSLMESCGALWSPMEPYGALRSLMESCGALWSPVEPYRALWSPMEPYGVLWSPMEPYGALQSPIGPYGPWSKVVHYTGNRVHLQPCSLSE